MYDYHISGYVDSKPYDTALVLDFEIRSIESVNELREIIKRNYEADEAVIINFTLLRELSQYEEASEYIRRYEEERS